MAEVDLVQSELHERPEGSGELLEVHWVDLESAESLNLATITRFMIGEVRRRVEGNLGTETPAPFVYARHGRIVVEEV